MNVDEQKNLVSTSEERNSQRMVKCYWLFDTENGAPSTPPDADSLHIGSQGEE